MGFSRKETKSAPVVMTLKLSVGSINRGIYSGTTVMKEGRTEGRKSLFWQVYIYNMKYSTKLSALETIIKDRDAVAIVMANTNIYIHTYVIHETVL